MSTSTPRRWLLVAVIATSVAVTAVPASADPDVPGTAPEAVQVLQRLNHDAVLLTEEVYAARDALDARRVELERANAALTAAGLEAERARGAEGSFRGDVDGMIRATFQGAQLDPLAATLVSEGPHDLLDRMTALDVLARYNGQAMDGLSTSLVRAEEARTAAAEAQQTVSAAEQAAVAVEADLRVRQTDLQEQILQVEAQLARLTPQERAAYTDPGETEFVPSTPAGDGAAARAMETALTQLGKPYLWGATGPDSYDCSGLIFWSYQQHGVSLPRTSRDQARWGTTVTRDELRPGDFVALYSPVGHIGIYVGEGKYVNAPQGGDVVKVSTVPWDQVTALTRPTA